MCFAGNYTISYFCTSCVTKQDRIETKRPGLVLRRARRAKKMTDPKDGGREGTPPTGGRSGGPPADNFGKINL